MFDDCGDEGTRTPDPLHAKQVLYQLSYIPTGPADILPYEKRRGNPRLFTHLTKDMRPTIVRQDP